MKKKEVLEYLNKRVKIFLRNHCMFTGEIKEVSDSSVVLHDKFDCKVTIDISDISYVQEQKRSGV